ncbi:extracellular solute-binding protein [Pseudoroseomonas wenyumeiae]|uniref:Extracellular solute-binding protein n=1 Tax=Teichococcus wenyumeiae TaxID=2478470 RepID=A0A3A9JQE5_9PROT|nr:extracellular solute-binding protein [Pseudoroseomonas wenyumeiae]RKK06034.1 extracellular solute-binding protein [Pseudoroseomonas wenyumeiae]RMI19551.1 extracellular solute-binding protein [Pseudoroseomonas wenyumeiae]
MRDLPLPRRAIVGGFAATALAGALPARAAVPPLPKSPVAISIMDVSGALALHQRAFEDYRAARRDVVSRITFVKAPAPELASKIKAQQDAGRSDLDLILTASDGLSAGMAMDLWQKILPEYNEKFPGLEENYEPAALNLHRAQGAGYGVVCSYYPSGPLLEYLPDRVKQVPTTAEELLAWAKANPNRFMYARPSNSGPGRTFMMGLPYLLGDKDPKDPINGWDKTWEYLQEIGQYIETYPSGTGITMKELGDGSRDIIVSTTGWDINPRALGIVPKEAKIGTLKGFHWVSDANYMVVPKGLPADRLAVVLDMMAFVLQPKMQAYAYDEGYLYPGPAVKNVGLDLAPPESRKVIEEFGRPEYAALIADNPIELPLKPEQMVLAFRRWDELVGSRKGRR